MAAIFCKRPRFVLISSFCMQMPGVIQPTGLIAVYGCTPDRSRLSLKLALSVLSLSEPWEAPGWQVNATDADVKQVITSWLQTPNSSVFTVEYKPWYHCGANAEMVVVTTFRSDVYRLLHMCHVLIKVTVTFDMRVFVTLFLESFCIYIAVWAGEFLNTGCSEWWGFCVICW